MRHRKAACKEHEKQKKKQETGDWDVIVFDCPQESAGKPKRKMKLLQFHENRRPAYFGKLDLSPTHSLGICPLSMFLFGRHMVPSEPQNFSQKSIQTRHGSVGL